MPKQKAEAWPPPESFLFAEEVGAVSGLCGRFLRSEPNSRIVGPHSQLYSWRGWSRFLQPLAYSLVWA